MKIGIITFHFPINYGAVLQVYALYKTLTDMGHDVEIIDYQPVYHKKKFQWQWKNCGIVSTNLIYPFLTRKFNLFRNTALKLTPKRYRNIGELVDDPPRKDAYICGSDQVWNPDLTQFDTAYFLEFGPKDTKRIAYAGSIGRTTLTQDQQDFLRPHFQKFDYLSSREQSGTKLINDICGRQAAWVLDPTFLINDYTTVIEPYYLKSKKYILLINLQENPLLNLTANFIRQELKLPIIVLNNYSFKFWKQKGKRCFPGPFEYLSAIANAKFVVTNSFHGTVFSILLKKSFITTALSGSAVQRNSRMTGLLDLCGLATHFLEHYSEPVIKKLIRAEYDWEQINNSINEQRQNSLLFLTSALR